MGVAWRIVKQKHAGFAFSGEGARRFGGRWNSVGTSVVYTSASKSLAALEILVHLIPPVNFDFVTIKLEFDDDMVIKQTELPTDWKEEPPSYSTQSIGDQWIKEGRSAILEVPSAIVPEESNFLLNPAHPDYNKIHFNDPQPFSYDPRLMNHLASLRRKPLI